MDILDKLNKIALHLDKNGFYKDADTIEGILKIALVDVRPLYEVEKQIKAKEDGWPYSWRVSQLVGRIRGLESRLFTLQSGVKEYMEHIREFREYMDTIDAFQAQQEMNKYLKKIYVRDPREFVGTIIHFLVSDLKQKHGIDQ